MIPGRTAGRAGGERGSLAGLDEVAGETVRPARAAIDVERERLELAERTAGEREGALRSERADLAAERDPKPADPPWLAPGRLGEPLWRCVDFTDELAGDGRAGLEGALHCLGPARRRHPARRHAAGRRR